MNAWEEQWCKTSDPFEELWNMPHAVGVLDGKHFQIKCPKLSGSLYHNYKGFFNIVLLLRVTQEPRNIKDTDLLKSVWDLLTSFYRYLMSQRLQSPQQWVGIAVYASGCGQKTSVKGFILSKVEVHYSL